MNLEDAYAANAIGPRTRDAHAPYEAAFRAFCERKGLDPYDDPRVAVSWVREDILPLGGVHTVRDAFAAISAMHARARKKTPTGTWIVKHFREGLRRRDAERERIPASAPSVPAQYREIFMALENGGFRAKRAAAMVAMMRWGGAARRHVCAALRENTFSEPGGVRIVLADRAFPECLIGRTDDPWSPADTIEAYLQVRGEAPGALFADQWTHVDKAISIARVYKDLTDVLGDAARELKHGFKRWWVKLPMMSQPRFEELMSRVPDSPLGLRVGAFLALLRSRIDTKTARTLRREHVRLTPRRIEIMLPGSAVVVAVLAPDVTYETLRRFLEHRGAADGYLFRLTELRQKHNLVGGTIWAEVILAARLVRDLSEDLTRRIVTPRDHRAGFLRDAVEMLGTTRALKVAGFRYPSSIERYGGSIPKNPIDNYYRRTARLHGGRVGK